MEIFFFCRKNSKNKIALNITLHIGESHDLTVTVEAWRSKDPGLKR